MFQKIIRVLGGDPQKREIERLAEKVEQINALEKSYEGLSLDGLRSKTDEFRARFSEMVENGMKKQEALDELLPDAFSAVREASKRTIGLRHYDVQMIGGAVLHEGKIAEMRTGEGKTLVATLPLYLNALTSEGVLLVTVNDYLARRDARWMAPIYMTLGMSVGVLQMAGRTDNGKMAFIVDPERTSPHEDQHQLRLVQRKEAYDADITYGMNSEFGFDYLRDNLTMSLEERVQRGHYFAIVDEVDNILIDEARTPLIISGPASDESEWYIRMAQVIRQLRPEDYEIMEKDRSVALTELGEVHVEEVLEMQIRDPERPEDITPEQARVLGYLEQALRAQFLYKRNKDYLVQAGKVIIVDEFTGRLMPGRRWSEGLHQAIEAKEGVKVEPENVTYATITLQNYYRMHEKLAGMTGTAATEAEEFHKIYKLDVITIPTNLEFVAAKTNAELVGVDTKDEQGYKYTYYTHREDPERKPVFWKRKDFTDVVYRSEEAKLRAISQEILRFHVMGRPQLVGTTSVDHSERLSHRLGAEHIRRLAQVLTIRQAWLEKSGKELLERPEPELQPLNVALTELDTGTLRPVARSLEISLNPEDDGNLNRMIRILNLEQRDKNRLLKALQGGVSHQVLNAKKHDEESMIIARAGAFGAVTIATNMAGRGVDIKLGGDLPEDLLNDVNRVIYRMGQDPYDMLNEERRQALLKISVDDYGIYQESVNRFLQYVDEMKRVRELGGLHVIGSERHEARRIDNQLRGRSARQGDPGSSRFFLSLEDDLMRLFGGPQVENLWKRVFFDDNLPMEMNILGRLVEQSQERVEGYNFDVRKHLLEYDDVLNAQRKRIYEQRDRAFTKEDLQDDVLDMLRSDLQRRIPEALKDEEGPWKLLAYLNEIQPPISYESMEHPSFPLALMSDKVEGILSQDGESYAVLGEALIQVARQSMDSERDHLIQSAESLLEKTGETLEAQVRERVETLETYIESIGDQEEGELPKRPQDILTELSETVRIPLRLNLDQVRHLAEGDRATRGLVTDQIEGYLKGIHIGRLVGAIERRLEESLDIKAAQLIPLTIDEISRHILSAVTMLLEKRIERLVGEEGQITIELNTAISRTSGDLYTRGQINRWLMQMAYGSRMAFDQRTHRKVMQRVTRINYVFLAAKMLSEFSAADVIERVLQHMESGLKVLQTVRGVVEWNRLAQTETSLSQLDEKLKIQISKRMGIEKYNLLADQPVGTFEEENQVIVKETIGWWQQNQVYRELFLRVISDQWVDYLTRVEALRVSIGMEAYAQRDPLVQYKSQATDMFKSLLGDIRIGIVSRLFTFQARRLSSSVNREHPEADAPVDTSLSNASPLPPGQNQDQAQDTSTQKKKRKRH